MIAAHLSHEVAGLPAGTAPSAASGAGPSSSQPLSSREALAVYEAMDLQERALLLRQVKEQELRQLWGEEEGQRGSG